MGFVSLMKNALFDPHLSFEREKIKKSATPMALFSTNHTLPQGSLHYRLATLGYQKRNPDGVRQFCKYPLYAALPFDKR